MFVASVLKLMLTIMTFGMRIPAGLFIPTMAVGALLGRGLAVLLSEFVYSHNHWDMFSFCLDKNCLSGGMYGLVGAAAALGGVTRMTVSLAVILFELTGGLDAIVPLMLVLMIAKWVGDSLGTEGIYDEHIELNKYPYLDNRTAGGVSLDQFAFHVCSERQTVVVPLQGLTVESLAVLLKGTTLKSFPLVRSIDNAVLEGVVYREDLRQLLEEMRVTSSVPVDTLVVALPAWLRSQYKKKDAIRMLIQQCAAATVAKRAIAGQSFGGNDATHQHSGESRHSHHGEAGVFEGSTYEMQGMDNARSADAAITSEEEAMSNHYRGKSLSHEREQSLLRRGILRPAMIGAAEYAQSYGGVQHGWGKPRGMPADEYASPVVVLEPWECVIAPQDRYGNNLVVATCRRNFVSALRTASFDEALMSFKPPEDLARSSVSNGSDGPVSLTRVIHVRVHGESSGWGHDSEDLDAPTSASLFTHANDAQTDLGEHVAEVSSVGAGDGRFVGTSVAADVGEAHEGTPSTLAGTNVVASRSMPSHHADDDDMRLGRPLSVGVIDIGPLVNWTPLVVSSLTPLLVVREMFTAVGVRELLVVDGSYLRGIITKKDLVRYLWAAHGDHDGEASWATSPTVRPGGVSDTKADRGNRRPRVVDDLVIDAEADPAFPENRYAPIVQSPSVAGRQRWHIGA